MAPGGLEWRRPCGVDEKASLCCEHARSVRIAKLLVLRCAIAGNCALRLMSATSENAVVGEQRKWLADQFQRVADDNPVLEGWMYQADSDSSRSARRHFILKGSELSFAKTADAVERPSIDLCDASVRRQVRHLTQPC